MKFQQENNFKYYSYPEEMLNYIRVLVHNIIKGEIIEDLYKVCLKEFCKALQIVMIH